MNAEEREGREGERKREAGKGERRGRDERWGEEGRRRVMGFSNISYIPSYSFIYLYIPSCTSK